MQVKLFEASWRDKLGRNDLEKMINEWMKEAKPVIEYVTHLVHANKHFITVWYMG